jgi:hypothetical protein
MGTIKETLKSDLGDMHAKLVDRVDRLEGALRKAGINIGGNHGMASGVAVASGSGITGLSDAKAALQAQQNATQNQNAASAQPLSSLSDTEFMKLLESQLPAQSQQELYRRKELHDSKITAIEQGYPSANEVLNQQKRQGGIKAWTDEGQGEGLAMPQGTDNYHSGAIDEQLATADPQPVVPTQEEADAAAQPDVQQDQNDNQQHNDQQ